MSTFSNNLKQVILEKNITQAELSKITGISKSFISQYLAGKFEPKYDKLRLLSTALGVSEEKLLGIEGNIVRKNFTTNNVREILVLKNNQTIGKKILHCEEGEFFCFVCADMDNFPFVMENDILLVKKCEFLEDGFYAIKENDNIIFRKCSKNFESFTISTYAKGSCPYTFLGNYEDEITLIGRVCEIMREIT